MQIGINIPLCAALVVTLLFANAQTLPSMFPSCPTSPSPPSGDTLIAGGQNGTWFQAGQYPRLFKIALSQPDPTRLATFHSQGTIWSGSTNGTEWLLSGWGNDRYGANPPIILYDTSLSIVYSSSAPNSNSSWYGGDIFASSYGKHEWLLSGMGSGDMVGIWGNHMALATFNGSKFTDYSSLIPDNQAGILYTNDWNGSLWMVGGGYRFNGELFTFNGTTIHDLRYEIPESVPSFGPVTSIAWNGTSWLIGGEGFVALYNGHQFIDLTDNFLRAVGAFYSVNAVNWDREDSVWLLAGGYPRADVRPSKAWIATLSSTGKARNLSSLLSCYTSNASSSSILSSSYYNGLWALGGYAKYGKQLSPILLVIWLPATTITDYSHTLSDITYVIWVKFSVQHLEMCGLPNDWANATCLRS